MNKMELITVNFLSIGSFCMLILYTINSICGIKLAAATVLGGAGGVTGMSLASNGEFIILIVKISPHSRRISIAYTVDCAQICVPLRIH